MIWKMPMELKPLPMPMPMLMMMMLLPVGSASGWPLGVVFQILQLAACERGDPMAAAAAAAAAAAPSAPEKVAQKTLASTAVALAAAARDQQGWYLLNPLPILPLLLEVLVAVSKEVAVEKLEEEALAALEPR